MISPSANACPWALKNRELREYHDSEWGVPVRDDHRLFELLTLESAQSGLSWLTVLRKREGYQAAFAGFDPDAVASFSARDLDRLVGDDRIIRHRGKVRSTINNARALLAVRAARGSFTNYVWDFVADTPVVNRAATPHEVPSLSPLSVAMSIDFKRRGFTFVGPTTMYSFLQAAGLVNDHLTSCPRWAAVQKSGAGGSTPQTGATS